MVTARQVINSTKSKTIRVPKGKTQLGSAGYDNPRDDIERVKKMREGSVEKVPSVDNDITNKKYVDNKINEATKQWDFTIIDPSAAYAKDTQIFIAWATAALTISKIQVELDASTNEVLGDLKYADDFLALGNPAVINDFDTTSGKRTDTSITLDEVASGKAIYLQFDSAPNAAIKQMHVHIEWSFD